MGDLDQSLDPYLEITQAVRIGNMLLFQQFMDQYIEQFEKDKTYMLITRLSHNVIKTTLRNITLSYSRIYLKEISEKLNLNTSLETEYIVSKAIRDGVIDAFIDHKQQIIKSKKTVSIYLTNDPQSQLDRRIKFCLQLHRQCLKSLSCSEKNKKKIRAEN